ncbi:LacI family DNA-binding transcriptional regulator [Angustibacter sp. McL0619]|uniref:LacI family DNA-binding transcriptional regulator n=1 Tax=Angustibacter sp. McL0619 TaxID=3415676 RepID=UPI003CF3158C
MPKGAGAPLRPTMRDVAGEAGVSKALVSIVFRGAAGASDETRARVFAAAERIGYRANRTASLLALHRTRHLGVALHIANTFHGELVDVVQAAADQAGYELVLSIVTPRHDETRAVETLLEYRCEGLILLGSLQSAEELARLGDTIPLTLIGRSDAPGNVDVVRSADDVGLGLLVDHLVGLGHRRIAHVDGGRTAISTDRRRGYRAAMHRAGLTDRVLVLRGGLTEQDGWRAAEQLLQLPEPPTAVVAFNDHCAFGVLGRVQRAGLRVPDDVSVTGYDDAWIARYASVDLTTVSQDAETQGAWAVQSAVARLEGRPEGPRERVVEPLLVVRGSTGPPGRPAGPVEC